MELLKIILIYVDDFLELIKAVLTGGLSNPITVITVLIIVLRIYKKYGKQKKHNAIGDVLHNQRTMMAQMGVGEEWRGQPKTLQTDQKSLSKSSRLLQAVKSIFRERMRKMLRKLGSRKFWSLLAALATAIMVLLNVDQDMIVKICAVIGAFGSIIIYMLVEGANDKASIQKTNLDEINKMGADHSD